MFDDYESQDFDELIQEISSKPVLALSRPDLPFAIDTNASAFQVVASLFQISPDREWKPIAFWSRSLSSHRKK